MFACLLKRVFSKRKECALTVGASTFVFFRRLLNGRGLVCRNANSTQKISLVYKMAEYNKTVIDY